MAGYNTTAILFLGETMYHIRLYENTGFNSVNVPFSKEYLTVAANKVYDSAVGDLSGFDGLLEPLDIIQNRNLAAIRIHAPWSWVNQADYVVLYTHSAFEDGMSATQKKNQVKDEITNNGWCYIITNAVMANTDTAVLSLVPDYLTSVNAALEIADPDDEPSDLPIRIVDGIVSRSSWALNQVKSNASGTLSVLDIDLNDSLLTPSGTMEILTDRLSPNALGSGGGRTILLSTIDLSTAHYPTATKFQVPNMAEEYVVVPVLDYVDIESSVQFEITAFGKSSPRQLYPGVMGWSYTGVTALGNIKKALSNIRALGLEDSIIAQYYIPSIYCEQPVGKISILTGSGGILTEEWETQNVAIRTHLGSISNILNYSPYESVGLVSASGSKMEAHPQDLRNANNSGVVNKKEPLTGTLRVGFVADPRPNGKPYFTIIGLHGLDLSITSLMLNCVDGLGWQNVPLNWNQGASGNALNTIRYETTYSANKGLNVLQKQQAKSMYDLYNTPLASRVASEIEEYTKNNNYKDVYTYVPEQTFLAPGGGTFTIPKQEFHTKELVDPQTSAAKAKDAVSKAAGFVSDFLNGAAHFTGINAMLGYDIKSQSFENDMYMISAQFAHDSILDKLEYDISNTYYTPSIAFPYGASIWDFLGNGVVRYKYKYSGTNEIHRLTSILKAYGVQYKEYLSKKYFSSAAEVDSYDGGAMSTKFIYLQTSSATVSGRARWINEGIAVQLNNGVRFWKGKPRHIVPTTAEETEV